MKPKSNLFHPRSIQILKSLTVLMTVGLLGTSSSLFADDILGWNLPKNTTGESSVTVPVATAGISGTEITVGSGTIPTLTESSWWNRAGFYAADFTSAQSAGDYYSFSSTVATGYTAIISGVGSSIMRKGSAGPTTVGLFHSSDNITFTQVGTSAALVDGLDTNLSTSFSSTLGGTPIVITNGEVHYWRVVAFGGTAVQNSDRLRWKATAPIGFSFTGTVFLGSPPANLVWTGTTGNDWNTVPENTNWKDVSDVAAPFETGSNVTIGIPATIAVDAGGISASMIAVTNSSGTVALSGGVITSNSLNKSGAGVLTISNTLGTQTVFGSPAGMMLLNIADGGVTFDGSSSRYLGGNMIWDAPVTLNGGLLEFHGGSVGGTGSIGLTADSTLRARFNYGTATVKNPIDVPAAITLDVDSPNGTNLLTVQGAISGDGSVEKTSNGEVRFDSPNNYTGGTNIAAGILTISNGDALGAGSVTVVDGGQLRIDLVADTISNDISLSGTTAGYGNIGKGALVVHNETQTSTFSGAATLTGDALIRSYSGGGGVIFAQPIGGTGNLTIEAGGANKTHNQHWTLQGSSSTFVGDVKLRSDGSANAWVSLDSGSLPAASILTMEDSSIVGGNNAVLDLNGNDQTLAGLVHIAGANGLGSFITNGSSRATLTIDGASDTTFDGVIGANTAADITGQSSGGDDISLVKMGVGTLALNGANTYTGDTTVNGGTLSFATSNFSDTSTVTIDGGTLNLGSGTDIVGSLVIGGISQPGGGFIYNSANTAGITGGGAIQVGESAGFSSWVTSSPYNLSGNDALPGADPDHDGIANSIEFVIGGNPAAVSDSDKLPTSQIVGTNLVFTYRLTDGSAYLSPSVEYGTNLTGWTAAVDGENGVTIGAPTNLGGGVKQIVVTIPKGVETKRFARLRVVVP